MLMPSIFGENLFDDWMDFPFDRNFFEGRDPLYGKHAKNIMKTDVRETDDTYELDIHLPGFKNGEGCLRRRRSGVHDHQRSQGP